MTRRQANWLIVGWCVSFLMVIGVALFLTWKDRTKPSVFVPPAIWRELYTGGEPPLKFDI